MRNKLSTLITIGFLLAFLYYGLNNKEIFSQLAQISIIGLFFVALSKAFVYFTNGLFTKWSAEAFVKRLSLSESIYVGILSTIGNFFGPLFGGISIRAVYLKKFHKLPFSKFTSTLLGYYLILFSLSSIIAIVSLLILERSSQTNTFLLLFAGLLLLMICLMFIRLPRRRNKDTTKPRSLVAKLTKIIYDIEDGWKIIISDRNLMLKLVVVAFLSLFGSFITAFVEFTIIGADFSIVSLALYSVLFSLSILISLTPGAIGIRETILLLTGTTIGFSSEQILQVAVIDRGINFILLLVSFMIGQRMQFHKRLKSES